MHYYTFNIGDYRKDTAHLNIIEHGIYRQLIDWYYLDEKPIPKETQVVMRRLRLGSDELHLLTNVLKDFFNDTEFGYTHDRIQYEIEQYQANAAKNRVNGKLGGRPRKTQVVIKQNPNESETKAKLTLTNNHKPLTNTETLVRKKPTFAHFAAFWAIWPNTQRKVGKAACLKKWQAKNLDANADAIIAHVTAMLNTKTWQDGFEPSPITYINQQRWLDGVVSNADAKHGSKAWFMTASGIEAKATELGIYKLRDETWPAYKARVYKAAGVTPEMLRKAQNDS